MTTRELDRIRSHYGEAGILERITSAVEGAGLDPDALTREEVAGVEEFHLGGREATRELAEVAGFGDGDRILDIGAGLGGPARTLAAECGCEVTALEPTPEFCAVARWLNERLGFDDRVTVREGYAPELDLPEDSFDGAVLQHVTMNIADKAELFRQCHRVLRPRGRLAYFEICRGTGGEVSFPVPWADEPTLSHLEEPDRVRGLAERAGFGAIEWRDVTDREAERFDELLRTVAEARQTGEGPPALGLHLVIGESMPRKLENLKRSFDGGCVRVVRGVLEAVE